SVMKIVQLLAPARVGGLESVVRALAIGHHRLGHQVTVVPVVAASDEAFAAPLSRAGVEVRPIIANGRAYRQERAAFREILLSLRSDVVHSHGYHCDVLLAPVARRERIATVSTMHGFTRGDWRNRLYEFLDRRAVRKFDAVVAVSRLIAEEIRDSGVSAERVHVAFNAYSRLSSPLDRDGARRELGLAPERFVVGWVGRMTHEKGLDVLVNGLPALRDLPLAICAIGDGPQRAGETIRAESLGVADMIEWRGVVLDAGRLFSAFDAFVLSSRTEGVPIVMLEAMAANVPLVVTSVGGIPDVVTADEAILVPSELPDALSAGIRSVFGDRHGASIRARAAYEKVQREFSEGPWLARYAEIYAGAIRRAAAHN
ncbi:MAG TPA: glycosyltransferase, partial [Gemmatimonadaceae bacterium]|nr:glycosyltransferase [Gemmatimonadaceae bacterium]